MCVIDLSKMDTEDVCVSGIVISSGVRPRGRVVYTPSKGRASHGFLYLWEGEAVFSPEEGTQVRGGAGDLVIIPKGCRYTMRFTAEQTTFVLMNCQLTGDGGGEVAFCDRVTVVANDLTDRHMAPIMAKLELCGSSENSASLFRRKELAYRLLSVVFDDVAVRNLAQAEGGQILPGVRLLQQSYLENIPVGRFAEACGMSVSGFRRQFVQIYGLSPVQYRNRLRVSRAGQLLADGSCTVTEAAYACGFENLGYFCRCYKKLTGETPHETRTSRV